MKKLKNIYAFTIIELIIMVAILAILTTIGFMSVRGYTQDSRNSHRIADIKTLDKSMKVHVIQAGSFPLPDENTAISYSGALALNQGVFGTGVITTIGGINSIPRDPLTNTLYSYGLAKDRQRYEIGSAMEVSRLFSQLPQAHAVSNEDFYAYNTGNFLTYDLGVTDGNWCSLITLPSLIFGDIPSGGNISNGGNYNFSYLNSPHIPATYSGSIEENASAGGFTISQVFAKCTMNNIEEMELYSALLSTAYQALISEDRFSDVVYNYDSLAFHQQSMKNIESNGINIGRNLEKFFESKIVYRTFLDDFTDTDGTLLVGEYIPSPLESWNIISGGDINAYTIESNILTKNGVTNSLVYPIPEPNIAAADYDVQFDINNFAGGTVSVYLRYIDNDNYYRINISSSGYQIIRRLAGSDATLQNINDPVLNGSTVLAAIKGDSIVLDIDGIEKENIVAGGISDIGVPIISLQNDGASIDDYSLTYR